MTDLIRVLTTELQAGKPCAWRLYDQQGRVVLEKGAVVSDKYIERWLSKGLYRAEKGKVSKPAEKEKAVESYDPFTAISSIQESLKGCYNQVLTGCGECQGCNNGSFQKRIDGITMRLMELVGKSPDVALGYVTLSEEYDYTVRHPIKKAIVSELLGVKKGIAQQRRRPMVQAALTGNISMVALQEQLSRQQGKPTEAQWEQIRQHPHQSAEFLQRAGVNDEQLLKFVREHHEKEDGSGYPNGLSRDELELESLIISVADKYCAMLASRSYRTRSHSKDVLKEFLMGRGTEHDEELVLALIKEVSVYPPGTTVQLKNGEVGVVVRRGENPLQPIVNTVKSAKGQLYANVLPRDTAKPEFAISAVRPAGELGQLENRLWFLWGQ